jgi:arylsulfatase A-like enzyme
MGINDWFTGTIGDTVADSVPHHRVRPHPGEHAPNVVVVLLDDLGFAQLGCYGSTMRTPNMDALAAGGLRYTNFHVTPLCSPTRASLLTGRNHHTVGMRAIANFNTGFPHMVSHISEHATTMAEVLRDEGYATFAVGKWHLVPMEEASAAGPFDQWPCQRGFDRFYGFLQGETDQFAPELTHDNHHVDAPARSGPADKPDDGYHLSEDLIDHLEVFVRDSVSVRPDRPFLAYVSFGAMHAPHQAPASYLERWRGAFDEGWDVARDRWFARQLDLGIVPEGTGLPPRNPGVAAWDELPEDERRVAARLQEAFAAFLEHTDDQIGRLVALLDELGQLDNTLVVLTSDNGASQEGGPFGVMHEMKFFNGRMDAPADMIGRVDDIGGPHSHTNYPWGWAMAGNTPGRWYKQNTHGGGVRTPLIVHWPARVGDGGSVRHQFHHVTDIAATVYELLGVEAPATFRGVEQLPLAGTSLAYTFDDPATPSRKGAQYFEMVGHRAIWSEGWKAVTRHTKDVPFDDDTWELYHLEEDFSEAHDLAEAEPERLAVMVALWWEEARRHGVLPLDDRLIELFGSPRLEHSPHAGHRYTYLPPAPPLVMSHLPVEAAPALGGRTFTMRASVERPTGATGVLFALGTENSGVSLFVDDDERLCFDYNAFGDHTVVRSPSAVPVGTCTLGVRLTRTGGDGRLELLVDDDVVDTADLDFVMRIMTSVGADIGLDRLSPVSPDYAAPNAFGGRIVRLEVDVEPTRSERERLEAAAAAAAAAMARQ